MESVFSVSTDYNLSIIDYTKKFTNISLYNLSEYEKDFIKNNINLDNCYITNISQLKSGKLLSVVIPDYPDHYRLVVNYRSYYLVKYKKTNGDYYITINNHKPTLWRNGIDCSYFSKKEDFIGYQNGMGCELVDIMELLVPIGTQKVIDNSDYYSNQEIITDENIIDTSIFCKKENDV